MSDRTGEDSRSLVKQVRALLTPETFALLTPDERQQVEDVLGEEPPDGLLSEAHVWQTRMIRDPARFKVVMCNRRAGKSRGIAGMMLEDAWRHPYGNYLYAGISIESAKKAIWKDALVKMDRELGLGLAFNETKSTCTLPNGAVIYVLGMDSSEDQKNKARGGGFRMAIVDEAQEFDDLDDIISSIVRPAVSDTQGSIIVSGTPGQVPVGLFFRVSKGHCAEKPERWVIRDRESAIDWVGYTWSSLDNPFMREQIANDIALMIEANPAIVETPRFKREWRGMWVTDSERRVYLYESPRNDYLELPKYATGEWHYALGVDLGFNDDTAITAIAWHDHDRCAYVVDSDKRPRLDITAAANWIRAWMGQYDSPYVIVDGANKQAVEEMRRQHGLPLIAADKRGKADFIDLLNAQLICGNVKWSPRCEVLREEAMHLSWDKRAFDRGVRIEDPRASQHALDSFLYASRFVLTYLSEAAPAEIVRGSDEWRKQEEREMIERAERRIIAAKQADDDLWRYS